MARTVMDTARLLMKRRKFASVITLLESKEEYFEGNFDYFLTLGTACLYIGDIGNAYGYFQKAREIKLTNANLLLGQAAIFLRRGDTDRALQYYLDILSIEPGNERAIAAMEFIRKYGDFPTICKYVETGKIQRFYPPIGINPDVIARCIFSGFVLGAVASLCIVFWPSKKINWEGPRSTLEQLQLTQTEESHLKEEDLSSTVVHFIMDSSSIKKAYNKSLEYLLEYRDNMAQVEINRILNSNASFEIKKKAQILMTYIHAPTFDSLKDSFSYQQVMKSESDQVLYQDCYVIWSGRISNARTYENGSWSCELLVGYEDMKNVEGIVSVKFDTVPYPEIDGNRSIRFLGRLDFVDGNPQLHGVSVHQPLKGNAL